MDNQKPSELRRFSAAVTREGDWFVAQCLDVDIVSQGSTEDEALELYFEDPTPTEAPHVVQFEVRIIAA